VPQDRSHRFVSWFAFVWLIVFANPSTGKAAPEEPQAGGSIGHVSLEVGQAVRLPMEGAPLQLVAAAAPDDADRLMVCAFENDGEHARRPSAAYVSMDGGKTWMRTLLDNSSRWVSETSCTAGAGGRFYLVASASDTARGSIWHAGGTTVAYRSVDGGLQWQGPRRYPFIDWTAIVAANEPQSKGHKVYLFGNGVARGFGDAGDGSWFDQRAPMSVSEDGLHFAPPTYPSPPPEIDQVKTGYFPVGAIPSKDGSVLALFEESPSGGSRGAYALYKVDEKNYSVVGRMEMPPGIRGAQMTSAQIAADEGADGRTKLYVVLPGTHEDKPVLILGKSTDGGKTWSVHPLWHGKAGPERGERRSTFAGIAVNKNGVIGIEWLLPGSCPRFAVSVDSGESFEQTISLGSCKEGEDLESRPGAAQDQLWSLAARNGFVTFLETAIPFSVHITADAAGRFHLFWMETREDGKAALVTAAVLANVGETAASPRLNLSGAVELKDGTVFDVIRQEFDPFTGTFDIDLTLESVDTEIPYPSLLEVSEGHSDCEPRLSYSNAITSEEGGSAVFRIPKLKDKNTLLPGDRTFPVHLQVRAPGCANIGGSMIAIGRKFSSPEGRFFSPLSLRFHVLVIP
jgi:hypothetical protein